VPDLSLDSERAAYDELCCYTIAHGAASFIHQHVVDAFAAQTANEHTKPIALTFALVGLHLHVEKQFSGRQVQRAHMRLARQKQPWPVLALPPDRGAITATDVMAAPPGPERDQTIDAWCASVWEAFREGHRTIADLVRSRGIA
jgi:Family of unknown function (DUF5946)